MVASTDQPTVVDVAGGVVGGAARWRAELDGYLASRPEPIRIIGRNRRLTGGWLFGRERLAAGASMVFATNNVSFGLAGRHRRVLVHNALHFLYPSETELLSLMPAVWRTQIPIVRTMLRRADQVVAPCSAMAERVLYHLPKLGERLVVQMHPITPVGPREPAEEAFILVPVVPIPYKNLYPQVRLLAGVLRQMRHPARVRLTVAAEDLPADLAADPRIQPIGIIAHQGLSQQWRTAQAAFFPSTLEAFGYPLAEGRVYGVPVLAPFSEQAREIAGSALRAYDPADSGSLAEAIGRIGQPVTPDPAAFDRDRYFDRVIRDTDHPAARAIVRDVDGSLKPL